MSEKKELECVREESLNVLEMYRLSGLIRCSVSEMKSYRLSERKSSNMSDRKS